MRAASTIVLLLLLLMPGGLAAAASCKDAAANVARTQGVPERLMQAIAQVESAGQPFAVNVDGVGTSFANRENAIDFVRTADAAGARFIDVGCFQIDLHYHPGAFADLPAAFDPELNADYAARFLVALRGDNPAWDNAVSAYHSRDARLGRVYHDRVYGLSLPPDGAQQGGYASTRWFAGVRVELPGGHAAPLPGLPEVFTP